MKKIKVWLLLFFLTFSLANATDLQTLYKKYYALLQQLKQTVNDPNTTLTIMEQINEVKRQIDQAKNKIKQMQQDYQINSFSDIFTLFDKEARVERKLKRVKETIAPELEKRSRKRIGNRITFAIFKFLRKFRVRNLDVALTDINTLLDEGKLDEALEKIKMYLNDFEDSPELYYLMGKILEQQGKKEEALKAYEQAEKILLREKGEKALEGDGKIADFLKKLEENYRDKRWDRIARNKQILKKMLVYAVNKNNVSLLRRFETEARGIIHRDPSMALPIYQVVKEVDKEEKADDSDAKYILKEMRAYLKVLTYRLNIDNKTFEVKKIKDRYVIFILEDGCRADLFYRYLVDGKLPHIKKYIKENGLIVKTVTTLIPTISGPTHVTFYGGVFNDRFGFIGLRWFDKRSGLLRDYLSVQGLFLGSDYPKYLPTIFKNLGSRAISIFEGAAPGCKVYKMLYPLNAAFLHTDKFKAADDFAIKTTMFTIKSHRRLPFMPEPRFIAIWNGGVDDVSHYYGSESKRAKDVYLHIDKWMKKLVDFLKKEGIWNKTMIIFSADHGHDMTYKRLDVVGFLKSLGLRVSAHGMKNELFTKIDPDYYDAVVCYNGNNGTLLYFKDGAKWDEVLYEKQLRNYWINGKKVDLIEKIRKWNPEGNGYLIFKVEPTVVKVEAGNGETALVKWQPLKGKTYYTYEPLNGNPLKLPENLCNRWMDKETWLRESRLTPSPDVVVQLAHLFMGMAAPDIGLFAAHGYSYDTSSHYRGDHGGITRNEMTVPLIIFGGAKDIPRGVLDYARTVDVYPTVLEFFGIPVPKNLDGISLYKRLQMER